MQTPRDNQLTPPGGWLQPEQLRLPPIDPKQASMGIRFMCWLIARVGKLDASNLFLMLMHNFRLFWSWLGFAKRMMPFGELPRRETELAILRVGWLCRCRYEWGQHVDIALRAGVTAEEIQRVAQPEIDTKWEPQVLALLNACDELHRDRMLSKSTWDALAAHYDQRLLLEAVMLINHYLMLAGVLNSTGLPLDASIEQQLASAPIHQHN